VRYACEDLATLRKRLKRLDGEVVATLQQHQVGQLLTSIGGIGDTTAAMIIAELGDLPRFRSAGALAAYSAYVLHTGTRVSISRRVLLLARLEIVG
jgi:transposase